MGAPRALSTSAATSFSSPGAVALAHGHDAATPVDEDTAAASTSSGCRATRCASPRRVTTGKSSSKRFTNDGTSATVSGPSMATPTTSSPLRALPVVHRAEVRELGLAGLAVRRPEVEQHDVLAEVVAEAERLAGDVAPGEVRRERAGDRGRRTRPRSPEADVDAAAAGRERRRPSATSARTRGVSLHASGLYQLQVTPPGSG